MRASVLLLLFSTAAFADPRPAGTMAPDFTLPSTNGKSIELSKLRKAGPVVLAFFPKAFTGG